MTTIFVKDFSSQTTQQGSSGIFCDFQELARQVSHIEPTADKTYGRKGRRAGFRGFVQVPLVVDSREAQEFVGFSTET